ncbi:MAG: acetyl-CoA carboxylase biotin carboxyl carrier protein subunit [Sulfolobales archaeon]|nr:acetyl-CoA carboxylase biotin carboxyl carrier protein subunit [Sulfolobales archaeon]MCX8208679.1 acetyl-CoA carboxylase biotin carboxyl carrier protein subunit [Sulfolobales archaeon]MDW8010563.1 acetyl-CoA carboxylase biotin carboxyl carrier protein subunit [Sulfolobales archaeon]
MSERPYSYLVKIGDRAYSVLVRPSGEGRFKVVVEGVEVEVYVEAEKTLVKTPISSTELKPAVSEGPPRGEGAKKQENAPGVAASSTAPVAMPAATAVGGAAITSPIPGKVLKILTAPGDVVSSGKLVATLESMKMEVEVFSDKSGRVREIKARPGDFVNVGDPLIVLE